MINSRKSLLTLVVAVMIGIVSGCGGSNAVPVKGTVILPEDIQRKGQDSIQLLFHPSDEKATKGSAVARPKMSNDPKQMEQTGPPEPFTVMTGADKGLPPGNYKISAKLEVYGNFAGSSNQMPPGMVDDTPAGQFNSKYNVKQTPLSYTVTSGANEIVIDLKSGSVTAVKK